MNLREAAEMALEAWEKPYGERGQAVEDAIEALRQALAQPEQRPVGTYEGVMEAMLSLRSGTIEQQQIYGHMKDKLLYTAPPKQWVWLTAEEILDSADAFGSFQYGDAQGYKRLEFARAIEAKLKEKNT